MNTSTATVATYPAGMDTGMDTATAMATETAIQTKDVMTDEVFPIEVQKWVRLYLTELFKRGWFFHKPRS